jgi:hypothetical protein
VEQAGEGSGRVDGWNQYGRALACPDGLNGGPHYRRRGIGEGQKNKAAEAAAGASGRCKDAAMLSICWEAECSQLAPSSCETVVILADDVTRGDGVR